MGKLESPQKKKAPLQPVQAQEPEGKTMAPPQFSLESSPVQMKGGLWDSFTGAAEWAGNMLSNAAEALGFGSPEAEKASPETKAEEKAAPVADAKTVPVAEPKADAKAGKKDDKALTDYTFEKKDAMDPKTKAKYTQGELTTLMLEKAGFKDPNDWWSNFTTTTLFGFSTNSLHKDFANLLKNAEAKTVEKIIASQDYIDWVKANPKGKDTAASVGKFMGLKGNYSTLRGEEKDSASFHAFGLAIDFNVTQNPWISDSAGKLDKADPKDKKKTVRDKTGVMKDALDRAGALMGQTLEFKHVNPDHFNYDMATTYDNMSAIDKGFETYFGLGLDTKDAELKTFLDSTKDPAWKGKTTDEARAIINNDLDVLSQWWDRKDKKKDESEMIRTNGIMDLDRRMVLSMGEVGLDWGGKYGDMMHFDMRNTGIGIKLRQAKYMEDVKTKKGEMTEEMKADKIAAAEKKKADKAAADEKKKADKAAAAAKKKADKEAAANK